MDLDVMEQVLVVLFTGVRDTSCIPGHAKEGGESMDEARPYFYLQPLRCYGCNLGLCPSVLNRS